jgi:glutamyl-tRNA synthetase
MTKVVRTRFAPSPTGPLHIGSARTALFSWLLARHYGGQFVLRIEDTDQKRTIEGSLEGMMEGMRWLGLDWDEGPDIGGPYGPYYQSQRLPLYQEWADWLIEHGFAYRAYDTPEELAAISAEREAQKLPPGYDGRHRDLTPEQEARFVEEGRKPVVRFKAPQTGQTVVNDLVRGSVSFDNSTIGDIVLLKSDGFPTYHLAHIIDDHFMEISHVTRSIEWLPSLPLHVQLWQAFGWDVPEYAHLPVLLNPNGKGKLSKRHAGFTEGGKQVLVLVKEFEDAGYYGPAVVNFLTNIGWNFGDEREVFDVQEAIARFDGTRINPANSVYPVEKLDWLNGIYIREKMSDEELAVHLTTALEDAGLTVDQAVLTQVVPLVRTRIHLFKDVVEMAGFFFREAFIPAPAADLIPKKMDAETTRKALEAAHQRLSGLSDFTFATLESEMRTLTEELGLKPGQFFSMLRVAVTGQMVAPPIFETLEILGQSVSVGRIQHALESLANLAE